MNIRHGRWLPVTVLVIAVVALVGSIAWPASAWTPTGWQGGIIGSD